MKTKFVAAALVPAVCLSALALKGLLDSTVVFGAGGFGRALQSHRPS